MLYKTIWRYLSLIKIEAYRLHSWLMNLDFKLVTDVRKSFRKLSVGEAGIYEMAINPNDSFHCN